MPSESARKAGLNKCSTHLDFHTPCSQPCALGAAVSLQPGRQAAQVFCVCAIYTTVCVFLKLPLSLTNCDHCHATIKWHMCCVVCQLCTVLMLPPPQDFLLHTWLTNTGIGTDIDSGIMEVSAVPTSGIMEVSAFPTSDKGSASSASGSSPGPELSAQYGNTPGAPSRVCKDEKISKLVPH